MIDFTGTEGIIFRDYLVIADTHIGIEIEYLKKGINIPSQTDKILNKILKIKEEYGLKKLIICGDFKHNVPKVSILELKDIPKVIKILSENFKKVFIIKGNHDGGLEKIKPGVKNVKIIKELKIGDYVFTHGHKRPKFKGKIYLIGHHHLVYNFKTSIGETFYDKVFVFGETEEYYIFILPAFSSLAGSWEVGTFHGPIAKNIKNYEIYTLDGILIETK